MVFPNRNREDRCEPSRDRKGAFFLLAAAPRPYRQGSEKPFWTLAKGAGRRGIGRSGFVGGGAVLAEPTISCTQCGCTDCNGNGVDDRCDVSCSNSGIYCTGFPPVATSDVCNANQFPTCNISADCNGNNVPDECELASGASCDANLNNVLDECEYTIPSNVLLVDDSAPPGGDGLTWCSAFQDLQNALVVATAGKTIWVAQGTYVPIGCAPSCGAGDRSATFNLIEGVTILGGYAGFGAPIPNARDITGNPTILTGDLLGDDVGLANNADNALHVVTAIGVDATAVIDGVTIRAGHANGTGDDKRGAGMFVSASTVTISDCTFSGNHTVRLADGTAHGGGMYTIASAPTLDNCVFSGNTSNAGGGMFIDGKSGTISATITNSIFIDNTVQPVTMSFGGGVYVARSAPEFRNCKFLNNVSCEGGGGLCNVASQTRIINCLFSGNVAYKGGGVGNRGKSDSFMTNCTLSNNCADINGSSFYNNDSAPRITNSILVAGSTSACNPAPNIEGLNPNDSLALTFSLTGSPGFVDALGPDGVAGTLDDDLRLAGGSAAIDAGNNAAVLGVSCTVDADCVAVGYQTCTSGLCDGSVIDTDIDGRVRIVEGNGCGLATVDIGASEVQIDCGNGVCDPGETPCTCPSECSQFSVVANEDAASTCHDGFDNDCDCATDCSDTSDCVDVIAEDCTDFVDNDCDGLKDCADPDCSADPFCAPE